MRVVHVARSLNLAFPSLTVWPWGILALSFAVNLLVAALLQQAGEDYAWTGGLMSIYIVVFIGAAGSIGQYLSFCVGMGVTRRDFYVASLLNGGVWALANGTVLWLLSAVERATGGWGVSLEFFAPPGVRQDEPLAQWLVYVVPFVVLEMLGLALGVVSKRWGSRGVLWLLAGSTVVAAVIGAAGGTADGSRAVATWFADQPHLALVAGWPLLFGAVVAGAAYLVLRRTPA